MTLRVPNTDIVKCARNINGADAKGLSGTLFADRIVEHSFISVQTCFITINWSS